MLVDAQGGHTTSMLILNKDVDITSIQNVFFPNIEIRFF
jgi:hypothetical protein